MQGENFHGKTECQNNPNTMQKPISTAKAFTPCVSVWVITYNHAGYIGQCLDSILMQKTDFTFEICLGEDDSSDGTREICQAYAKKYPDIIRLFLRDRNDPGRHGCEGVWQFNFIETFRACRGKYIAMCDGDDFWTDPMKLQKQVDFLERHPDCSGCFHKISTVDETGQILAPDMGYPPRRQDRYTLDYLLQYSNFSPMFSVVFRNHPDAAPDWIKKAPFGDMIVHAGNLRHGDYGFIDQVMGSYRIHHGGLASGTSRLHNVKAALAVYRLIGRHMDVADRPGFHVGIRALKLSYLAEWMMQKIVPGNAKQWLDKVYGTKIRSRIRRFLF
jgi:glycosyltransferase involved in cell wall biosynthesis